MKFSPYTHGKDVQRRLVCYRKPTERRDGDWGIVCCGRRCDEGEERFGPTFSCLRCDWTAGYDLADWQKLIAAGKLSLWDQLERGWKKPTRAEYLRRLVEARWNKAHPLTPEHVMHCKDGTCTRRTLSFDVTVTPKRKVR